MTAGDAGPLLEVLGNPANYEDGFVMHAPITDIAAAREYVGARMAASPGHLAFTGRLVDGGPLGPAGAVVGTSSIGDVDLRHERAHIGWTMWDRR